jgi:hypothetical protein
MGYVARIEEIKERGKFYSENPESSDHLRDIVVDRRSILKLTLLKYRVEGINMVQNINQQWAHVDMLMTSRVS